MPHTSDNDKKAKDNQAKQEQKNLHEQRNRQAGKHSFSKKTDHL
ncbi:DUF3941 domain-containing protein [Priestia flexa]|jgi:Domain of unknown function (DUF3941)|uniref:DUF3941 domain-containing protein n=1 Tax=Priestia flexa TaxID=86664 RepID=A0A1N6YJV1_9BACI|nr:MULTISPECIES: DUF3941 domain-containing protein [Bacillaceae]OZT11232.1 DUF3941 domain-containing protein [Priestia aryabhattai]USY55785.1 DUF3941 domain-containing protein [Bacillus sp. 1780r2a1]MBN8251188.1 DUF3941 domain-containing protein [Priestia flexa]MBN8433392.1 DUF3941 domain-containing protein [Priestia flexa]MBY6086655.1 DUF3941 domain-containing protein [Priestia flexa]